MEYEGGIDGTSNTKKRFCMEPFIFFAWNLFELRLDMHPDWTSPRVFFPQVHLLFYHLETWQIERRYQEKGIQEQHVRLYAELYCEGFLTLIEVLPNLCVRSLTHASPSGSWDPQQITCQVCSILPSVWLLLDPVLPNPRPLPECKLQCPILSNILTMFAPLGCLHKIIKG